MKIPTFIEILLRNRTTQAQQLEKTCTLLNSWCKKQGIDPNNTWYNVFVQSYIPVESAEKYLREAIERKNEAGQKTDLKEESKK